MLDELAALNSGASPDAGHRPLPAGLAGTLDLARVGMFGHSLGGATAAEAVAADRRILAGIDLDGSIIVSGLPTPGDHASQVQVKRLAGAVAKGVGEQAKGVISARTGIYMAASFDHLRALAREQHILLETLARDVVDSATRPLA